MRALMIFAALFLLLSGTAAAGPNNLKPASPQAIVPRGADKTAGHTWGYLVEVQSAETASTDEKRSLEEIIDGNVRGTLAKAKQRFVPSVISYEELVLALSCASTDTGCINKMMDALKVSALFFIRLDLTESRAFVTCDLAMADKGTRRIISADGKRNGIMPLLARLREEIAVAIQKETGFQPPAESEAVNPLPPSTPQPTSVPAPAQPSPTPVAATTVKPLTSPTPAPPAKPAPPPGTKTSRFPKALPVGLGVAAAGLAAIGILTFAAGSLGGAGLYGGSWVINSRERSPHAGESQKDYFARVATTNQTIRLLTGAAIAGVVVAAGGGALLLIATLPGGGAALTYVLR